MELLETARLLDKKQKNDKFIAELKEAQEQIKICLKDALTKQVKINEKLIQIMRIK